MNYCPNCGFELQEEIKFCPNCGNPLKGKNITSEIKPIKKHKAVIVVSVIFALCLIVGAVLYFHDALKETTLQETPQPITPEPIFYDNPKAIQKAADSVLMLNCYDINNELICTGSAFAAFEEGVFITNYHVISEDVYSVIACTEDEMMFDISSILAFDEDKDIAIIKTSAKTGVEPLTLGDSGTLEKGEKVVAIGSPLGLINTVSTGVISSILNTDNNEIQFTASVSHGSSGGALFNENGEVIGITSASYTDGQNLNVAIPINEAISMWNTKSQGISFSELNGQSEHTKSYTVPSAASTDFELPTQIYVEGYVAVKDITYFDDRPCQAYIAIVESNADFSQADSIQYLMAHKLPFVSFSVDQHLFNSCSVGDRIVVLCEAHTLPFGDNYYKCLSIEVIS